MAATEPQRLALHAAARAALGAEEGDTLMALTPPANTDMATMQALERFEERLGARIDGVEQRLDARIDGVEQRLDARIDGVQQQLGTRIDLAVSGLRVDIEAAGSRTLRWCVGAILAAQAATVGSLTLLLG